MRRISTKTRTESGGRRAGPLARLALAGLAAVALAGCGSDNHNDVADGKQTFRFDTFGDETKWTDALHMDQVVATVDPTTALAVGLKVDAEALPADVVAG